MEALARGGSQDGPEFLPRPALGDGSSHTPAANSLAVLTSPSSHLDSGKQGSICSANIVHDKCARQALFAVIPLTTQPAARAEPGLR